MKSFSAQFIDLDVEIELFDTTKIVLKPKYEPIKTTHIKQILRKWLALESNLPEEDVMKKTEGRINLIAAELAVVYDKPVEWWQENVPFAVQSAILEHVAEQMNANKKK